MEGLWVTATSFHHTLSQLRAAGVDVERLQRQGALDAPPARFEARAPWASWCEALRLGASLARDPLFAWRAGWSASLQEVTPVSVVVATAVDGADGLARWLHYWPCLTNAFRWEATRAPDQSVLLRARGVPARGEEALAFTLADTVGECQRFTGLEGGVELWSPWPARAPHALYRALLGVCPHFEAPEPALRFSPEVMRAPMPGARPGVRALLEGALEAHRAACLQSWSWTQRVDAWLCERPCLARATAAEAAAALALSRRSLERHLAAEDTHFLSLRDERLRALAQRQLLEAPIKVVASELGYTSLRAFNRAFSRWTGSSPAAWRQTAPR